MDDDPCVMRKTLIIHTCHLWGGAERSLLEILEYSQNRHRYLLVLNPKTQIYRQAVAAGHAVYALPIEYITKHSLRRNLWHLLKSISIVSSRIWRICKEERILTVYCNTHKSLIYTALLLFSHCRIVCSCRDNVGSKAELFLIRNMSDEVIAVSKHIADQLHCKNVRWLHNAVMFPPTTPVIHMRKHYALAADVICIGMIGSVIPWKDQKEFIEIAAVMIQKQTALHFFIIGTCVDLDYLQQLQQLIEQLGLQRFITFTGAVASAGPWMAELDIVMHTAINEPFGRVIVEAMYLCRPIVAYACGGPAEILTHNETGVLIPPHDIATAAMRTLNLAADSHERQRLGTQAAVYARSHFDMSSYVKELERSTLNCS